MRPQDEDPGLMRFLRRTNLESETPFPENYAQSLTEWISNLPPLASPPLARFSDDMVLLQDAGVADAEIVGLLKPLPGSFSVLSVDFKVYNGLSFDGNISI